MLCGVLYRVLQGLRVLLADCVQTCSLSCVSFMPVECFCSLTSLLPFLFMQQQVYGVVSISIGRGQMMSLFSLLHYYYWYVLYKKCNVEYSTLFQSLCHNHSACCMTKSLQWYVWGEQQNREEGEVAERKLMREKKRKCWECVELDGPGWGNNFKEYLK